MLKRAMTGGIGLMAMVGEVQQEAADPIKIDRRVPERSPRQRTQKCAYAKRATVYARRWACRSTCRRFRTNRSWGVLATA